MSQEVLKFPIIGLKIIIFLTPTPSLKQALLVWQLKDKTPWNLKIQTENLTKEMPPKKRDK
jgi:hypothetical protein